MIAHKNLLFSLVVICTGFILVSVKVFYDWESFLKDKLYPQVYIDETNFGKKFKTDVIQYFDKKNQPLKSINLHIELDNQVVATISGEKINLHYDSQGLAERAYLIGRSTSLLARYWQKIAMVFFNQPFQINSNLDFDQETVYQIITDLEESYNQPAKNALFKFENERVVSFSHEQPGVQLDSEGFYQQFNQKIYSLKQRPQDQTVVIKKIIIQPEISLAEANSFGIEELIGEGRSDFSHSINERIHNIILASSKFNGVLIAKDKIISFNDLVGDISALTGYKPAYIIKGGKTVLGDGGGVCQVSTTLYRAALNAGLPVIERSSHAYRVSYYENDAKPGLDATVFAPSVDLKIKNDTPAYILIQTEVDRTNRLLYFRFYGKKDHRQVTITTPTLWDVRPPPEPLYQEDPTLKRGITKQVDFAAWGGKASFDYNVVYPDGSRFEKKFYSVYRPWQAVFLVGTAE